MTVDQPARPRDAVPRDVVAEPSAEDGFVRLVSHRLGGPLGRRAAAGRAWWSPVRVTLAVATLTYLVGMIFRIPCRITMPGQAPDHFRLMCYSDIGLLYQGRGLMAGLTPYLQSSPDYPVLEYPVLTGWFLELERLITRFLGGAQGTGLSDQQQVASTLLFVDVNQVLLGLLFLVAVWAQVSTVEGRPWDAMMLAASPCVAAAAQVNWDLLVIALTALGCLFWARRRPIVAGVLLGLATAAKLYPVLLLGPLILLCVRTKKLNDLFATLGGFMISWSLVNLPVVLLAPESWLAFWTFNSDREGDLGSLWYVFELAGHPVPALNLLNAVLLLAACLAIGWLIMAAPRRPRFGAMAFLVVAAFLITNKVYSPQYVLWLLPLLILARPRWRDWWLFTAAELFYFAAIWWHLAGVLKPADGSADRLYWVAVIVRIGVQCYLVVQVVLDALRPERDLVRAGGADDPGGGVLDRAADRGWSLAGLRSRRLATATPAPARAAGPDPDG